MADAAELARVGAEEILDRLGRAAREARPFRIALAGGRTPRGVYERLAAPPGTADRRVDWSRAHVFWGDERAVPPEHPESNYRMAREAFLSKVPIPEAQVHRIRGELPDPAAA
ncbi:MAG TPA: 6-phosphogluconolactonase, partial [Candidatus Eisenbacteria bacterium]